MIDPYLLSKVKTATMCIRACQGLTPEQVEAIPRLIAWFTDPSPDPLLDEFERLQAIFPARAKA